MQKYLFLTFLPIIDYSYDVIIVVIGLCPELRINKVLSQRLGPIWMEPFFYFSNII